MTELFIDGVSVVLPKEFSAQVKRENPLITKNGEYTYDVTLNLTNPTNAELYKHLNRLNSVQEIKEKRQAVLVADNRVYCNGTEIITAWTEKSVTIQIASGNSELNYFIGGDLKISSLKMKSTAPGYDNDAITNHPDYLKYVEKIYPEVDYCLAPVKDDATGEVHNNWCIDTRTGTGKPSTIDFTVLTSQPYLMCYISDMIRALDYDLEYNQLADTLFKNLYICHTESTHEWNKMLPGWSVNDFFSEIEELFNVVFLVNNKKRSVRLLLKNNFYAGCQSSHVQRVIDVYEAEIDEKSEVNDPVMSNVEYKFSDCDFWRWASLSDTVKNKAKYDTIPESFDYDSRAGRLNSWFSMESHQGADTIYKDEKDGREYISTDSQTNDSSYAMVNHFAKLEREGATNTVELEIVPAAFDIVDVNNYQTRNTYVNKVYIPTIIGGSKSDDTKQENLIDIINNNSSESSESKKEISLAFFTGMWTALVYNRVPQQYPRPYVDEYTIYISDRRTTPTSTNNIGASLRLVTLDKLLYQGGYDIDYTRGIKINSHDPNLYDTRSIFEIRNKRYICKDMEFTLNASGRKGAWTGTFYPIKISDTEADAKWILTDGKWRDGGVWLDNGRWLDE